MASYNLTVWLESLGYLSPSYLSHLLISWCGCDTKKSTARFLAQRCCHPKWSWKIHWRGSARLALSLPRTSPRVRLRSGDRSGQSGPRPAPSLCGCCLLSALDRLWDPELLRELESAGDCAHFVSLFSFRKQKGGVLTHRLKPPWRVLWFQDTRGLWALDCRVTEEHRGSAFDSFFSCFPARWWKHPAWSTALPSTVNVPCLCRSARRRLFIQTQCC